MLLCSEAQSQLSISTVLWFAAKLTAASTGATVFPGSALNMAWHYSHSPNCLPLTHHPGSTAHSRMMTGCGDTPNLGGVWIDFQTSADL